MAASKMITLKSLDGQMIKVPEKVAMESRAIRNMMKDESSKDYIEIPIEYSVIAKMVFLYCEKHLTAASAEDGTSDTARETKLTDAELKAWDKQFLNVELGALDHLIVASDRLKVVGLIDLLSQNVADRLEGKSPEEIRKIFNIKDDFSAEEKTRPGKYFPSWETDV